MVRERKGDDSSILLYPGISDGSESLTGLWLDMLAFAVVVIQIILSDTRYGDQVQNEKIEREEKAAK